MAAKYYSDRDSDSSCTNGTESESGGERTSDPVSHGAASRATPRRGLFSEDLLQRITDIVSEELADLSPIFDTDMCGGRGYSPREILEARKKQR